MQTVKVWDLPVRLCHWGLAACVLANLLLTEDGSDIHEYVGYAAIGIVLFRLLWGFIGSRHARFADFWPSMARIRAHVGKLRRGEPEEHPGAQSPWCDHDADAVGRGARPGNQRLPDGH